MKVVILKSEKRKNFDNLFLIVSLVFSSTIFGQTTLPVSRTEAWTTTPSGWTDNSLSYYTSSQCTGANSGKLDAQGDYCEVYFTGTPDQLTYTLKNQGFVGTFKSQEYYGGSYHDLQSTTTMSTTCTAFNYTLNSGTSKVKFIYDVKTSGNITIDEISVTASSCTPPTTQATSFSANSVTETSMNIAFTRGNGTAGVMVVARSGGAVNADPTSGTTYSASSIFGSGTQIGTGNYVVYKWTANGVSSATGNIPISGLSGNTTYHFAVYEYNTTGICFNMVELTGNQTTLAAVGSSATDYFRSLATGNWNTAGAWQSSPDNTTWITSTLVPTSSATLVTIQTGHTITINADATASSIVIEGTGKLTFDGVSARNVTVTGDITINASGGTFYTQSSGAFTNTLSIAGNIVNNGTFNMARGANLYCDVTFNKNGNQSVSGTGSTTAFNEITIDMGTSNANILEISSSSFTAPDGFLETVSAVANRLKNGTLKFSGNFTYSGTPFIINSYNNTIVSTAGFWLNNPNVTITGFDDSYDIKGFLRITNGTLNVGTATGNSLKYYTGSVITIEGGIVNVAGRFYCNTTSQSTTCTITGGTITLITQGSSSASSKFAGFQMSATSTFVWSNGTIVLQQGQAYYGGMDYSDASTTSTVTGGTLQFCNSNSTGGVNAFYLYSINSIPNLIVTSTNSPTVYLFSNLTVLGNISVASGATIDTQADPDAYAYEAANIGSTVYVATANYNISLKGNWINNGTFSARDKTVTFNGITSQDLSGSTTTSFYNLTMLNASTTGLTFSSPGIVTGALTLTDGIIYTSNPNYLTLNAGSTATSGSAASFVDGPMKKIGNTDFVFPLGDGTKWRRIKISSLSGSETFTSQYINTAYSDVTSMKIETDPLTWVSNTEYWTLSRAAAIDAIVELYWEDATASSLPTCTDLRIAHWDNTNSYWEKANIDDVTTTGSCSGTSSGTIYSNADLVEFSPFTFGSITIVALPISLVSFDAKLIKRKVELTWTTLSEINNDFFTIEKTLDGLNYEFVAEVNGAGNSNSQLNYFALDETPYAGISYYRLKQTDFDGNNETFPMRTISTDNSTSTKFSVYPNPTHENGQISIAIIGNRNESVNIRITDILGKEYFSSSSILNHENESFVIQLPENMSAGIYFVTSIQNGIVFSEKLTVQ